MTVSGRVSPIAMVGELVLLSLQRKAPNGRWTQVSAREEQVRYVPPKSWQGTFNTEITSSPSWSQSWKGRVTYTLADTDLIGHYAEYTMTSATGIYTWTDSGEDWMNDGVQRWWLTYSGTPVQDMGGLRWYFAKHLFAPSALEGIAGDSYEGSAFHNLSGIPTITWADGTIETLPVTPSGVGAWIWPVSGSSDGPRPLLEADLHMRGTQVTPSWPSVGSTESLDWDLGSSDPALPVLEERSGFYFSDSFTAKKKGLYRARTTITSTFDHYGFQTPWRTFTVN
jgi:hypothetical protein